MNLPFRNRHLQGRATLLVMAALVSAITIGAISLMASAAGAPSLAISQVPLQVAVPVHPQVLLAIGNSESMDGNLSGAIMVGSASLGAGLSNLNTSSSPINYTVPAGFTPPVTPAVGGIAPYSALVGGNYVDNGDSRLNVAKAGVSAILSSYMQNTDFALATYSTSNLSLYTTWVYYMSAPAGFTFSATSTPSVGTGTFTVANPCFKYLVALDPVKANCAAMVPTLYTATDLNLKPYMVVSASSDAANVNDVLYSSNQPAIFVNYGGATLSNNTLAQYNAGNVLSTYPSSLPDANKVTGPTNAGYVPQSNQVMYAQRGFGYGASQSATSGNLAVTMTTAGIAPTAASISTALASFAPFLKPETNNLNSSEIKASAGQAALPGLLNQAKTSLDAARGTGACPPQQYVVLISDGLPTVDLAGNAWPPLGSSAGNGFGVTATFSATDGSLTPTTAFTNDTALIDTITRLQVLKAAGVNTYIIGLGAGVNPALNPAAAATLKAMALAGGTTAAYPATSPAALVSALNNILISIQAGSLATTQSAVSSKILKTGSVQYQASFSANDTPYQDWTGNLLQQSLDPSTGQTTGTATWSAQTLLDTAAAGSGWSTNRNIVSWDPALLSGAGGGIPFRTASLNAAQSLQLSGTATLQYLRGDTSSELRNGGTRRNRSHIFGDSVNSTPLYVGPPGGSFFTSSYFSFITTNAARTGMLYIGANDGMLHAFKSSTGAEQFAFVPNGVFSKLKQLESPLYNQAHQFYVDGAPQSGDVQFSDGNWHTLLVGGLNGGGNSIYAMDITKPATLTSEAAVASAVKWEFTDSNMGLSYSIPQTAPVNASAKFAVFFGNGYNSPSQNPWFYAVNAQTGQKLAGIDLCAAVVATSPAACDSTKPNGLSSVTPFNSDGLVGASATQVYAGDLQGNVWAIDVSSATPSSWVVRLLYQAKDSTGNRQAITTPPVVSLHPNYPNKTGSFVMFGTGRFLAVSDLTDAQTQTAYGIWDTGAAVPYSRSNLQPQTTTAVTASVSGLASNILISSTTTFTFGTVVGWYNDLPIAGQRFITNASLLNGLFVATLNIPPGSACSAIPESSLLELNFKNGGAPSQIVLDVNRDGLFNSADQYNGANPSGIGIGRGYASPPTFLYPPGQPIRKNITLSGGTMSSIANKNTSQRSTSWLQLQ